MSTYSNSAREVEMPDGNVVVLHSEPTGGANTTSNIKKFKYDDNGHVTESSAANATDLNLNSYSTPTTGSTDIGTSDAVQTAIGKLDHQSHIDQTNIWLVNKYGGGKNYLNSNDLDAIKALNTTGWTWNNNVAQKNSVSFTVNKDGTIKVNGTPSALTEFKLPIDHQAELVGDGVLSTGIIDTGDNPLVMRYSGGSYVVPDQYGYVNIPANTVATEIIIQVRTSGTAPSNLLYKPMLCTSEDWNASHDYQPYALPNSDLTYLEAEDRAALAEEIDSGAKNLLQLPPISSWNIHSSITATVSGNVITATRTSTSSTAAIEIPLSTYIPTNTMIIISGCPSGGGSDTYLVDAFDNGNYVTGSGDTGSGSEPIKFTTNTQRIRIRFAANTSYTNLKFSLMICTKAAFGISQKFVPYCKSNYALTQEKLNRCSTVLSSGSLNNIKDNEIYYVDPDVTDMPTSTRAWGFLRTTMYGSDKLYGMQEFFTVTDPLESYVRVLRNGTWQSWIKTGG